MGKNLPGIYANRFFAAVAITVFRSFFATAAAACLVVVCRGKGREREKENEKKSIHI